MTADSYAALNGAAGLFGLGLGLLALTRWLYYRNTSCIQDSVHLLLVLIGQSLLLAAAATWALRTMGGIGALWLIQLGGTLLFAVGARWWYGRRVELHAVLSATTARGLPLAEALSALAAEWGGVRGQRLERTARLVQQGIPLSEAAAVAGAGLSKRHLCWIGLGERMQTLPQALVAASEPLPDEDVVLRWQTVVTWLGCSSVFLVTTIAGVMERLIPEMHFLAEYAQDAEEWYGVTAGIYLEIRGAVFHALPLIAFAMQIWVVAWLIHRYLGVALLPFPRRWRCFRQREIASALRLLGFIVQDGQPLEPHLPWLAEHYPQAWVARRFAKTARAVERGRPILAALRGSGMISRAEESFLAAAHESGNLGWAACQLADNVARRAAFRLQFSLYAVCVPALFLLGLVVCYFALAVVVPLTMVVSSLQ